jgi:hypothetical protein
LIVASDVFCFCSLLQTEVSSEDKRALHQKELGEKLNQEAKERLAGQKTKKDDKRCAPRILFSTPLEFLVNPLGIVKLLCLTKTPVIFPKSLS